MSPHTRGDWRDIGGTVLSYREDRGVVRIADILRPYNLITAEVHVDDWLYNAHLIAAAPDLLAACESARRWIASHGNHPTAPRILDKLKAAISKARAGKKRGE